MAAIAVPQYQKAIEKSRTLQAITVVKSIGDAQELYYLANGKYADDFDELGIDVPGENYMYNSLKRKKLGVFDFGTKIFGENQNTVPIIAISNRWTAPEKVGGAEKAYFYIARFAQAQDPALYCIPQSAVDIYDVCKNLSGGKTKTINKQTYYVIL